jgi:hypothetical protein
MNTENYNEIKYNVEQLNYDELVNTSVNYLKMRVLQKKAQKIYYQKNRDKLIQMNYNNYHNKYSNDEDFKERKRQKEKERYAHKKMLKLLMV